MSEVELNAEIRKDTGKQKAKALRREGQIPAIYYAHDVASMPLSVDAYTLKRMLQKEVNVLSVVFPDGKAKKCIIRDIQRDPVTDEYLHVDFQGIKLDEIIKMTIPVILTGTPVGVKIQGGILEHPMREVEVEGLPLDIPEHLEIDVSEMEIGSVMTLENIDVEKYRFVTDIDHPVAICAQPKVAKLTEEEGLEGEEGDEGEAQVSEEEASE